MTTAAVIAMPDPAGSVRLGAGGLVITAMVITDPDVLAGARACDAAGQDLSCWLATSLHAGAVAVMAATSGSELTQLRASLAEVSGTIDRLRTGVEVSVGAGMARLESAVGAAVDPGTGGIALASQAAISRLATGVGQLLTGPGATVPGRIHAAVTEAGQQALAEITRALAAQTALVQMTVAGDRTAVQAVVREQLDTLAGQLSALTAEITHLHTAVAVSQAVATVPPGSYDRGQSYEVICHEMVGRLAHGCGDGGADRVGLTAGQAGKVGDLLVTLSSLGASPPKLVVEAKDWSASGKLSVAGWRDQLSRARENRSATVAMGLCPSASMPLKSQPILVLGPSMIVVGFDPGSSSQEHLVLAAFMLLRVTAAAARVTSTGTIDGAAVSRLLSQLREDLLPIATIERQAGSAEKAGRAIRDAAQELRSALLERIALLEIALAG
jgi:hypothetical protein